MEYIGIEELAKKWGISQRRLQTLCSQGKITGAQRFGRAWMIPKDAKKPTDGRTKAGRLVTDDNEMIKSLPKKTPFLYMTDIYNTPGTADECTQKLADNHEAQVLFEAEVAYSRGDIRKVYENANYLLKRHSGFYAVISAGMLLALCAIWHGDLAMWRQAKIHIAEAPIKDDRDRDIVSFSLTAVDSMLYDVSGFPEWFKMGCFEPLHSDSLPAAKVYYAKYLYAAGYAVATRELSLEGVTGLSLMTMIPFTLEPMISQAVADRSIMAEMYLRLTCAAVYLSGGNKEHAVRHIDRAVALALPDKLYGLLAEYCRVLGTLLEQRIAEVDPTAWKEIKLLYKSYNLGWSSLSGSVRGKTLVTTFLTGNVKLRNLRLLA